MYCANRTSVNATLKTFEIKPKGHNFAKSGRTDVDCKISFKALSYRVYYAAWYAVDLAIWKIKIIYFSKQTTILCGVICPSVNATVPIKLRSGCTYFGIRVVHAWHGTSPPSTSPIFSEIKNIFLQLSLEQMSSSNIRKLLCLSWQSGRFRYHMFIGKYFGSRKRLYDR